jgi:hypothetical protein
MRTERGLDAKAMEREFFTTVRPSSILQRLATPAVVAAFIAVTCSAALGNDRGSASG